MKLFTLLLGTVLTVIDVSVGITIGFTELDYSTEEQNGQAKLILTVSELPINITIPLVIMSFEQFENEGLKIPDAIDFANRNPAEYSLDPTGRRDFVNNGIIELSFQPKDERQTQEITVPIVDDPYNEALESFLVLVDPSFDIPGTVPEFLRDGIALVTIVDNDPIQLQFDRTSYTVYETEGLLNDMIRVTKGGVESEQILGGVVNVIEFGQNRAILDEDFITNKTYNLTFYPENASLPFPVTIINDNKAENIEQFGLIMSVANSRASNGRNTSATVTIIDSSDIVIGFENSSYTITEGSTSEICVTVKEPQDTVLDFLVPAVITSVDGTAAANRDYLSITRTISATTRTCFNVVTINNNVTNVLRNFTLTLMFIPIGLSRTFMSDTPSITIVIEDDDNGDPCEGNDCHVNADCIALETDSQSYQCVCKTGYVGDGRSCENPCLSGLHNCDVNAECNTTVVAPGYQCTCKQGYLGNGRTCVAICSQGSHNCHPNARCIPDQNGRDYLCQCNTGFVGDGLDCKNYCEANLHRCHSAADCLPTTSGYTCRCKRGYVGDGFTCDAICSPGTHDCHSRAYCIPSFFGQGYSCRCGIGMVGDGRTCQDYCEAGVHNCHRHADCSPTFGGYQCKCRLGYTGNGFSCTDVNECRSGNKCDTNANCINTDGGYSCSCKKDFVGNGLNCFLVKREPLKLNIEVNKEVPAPTTTEEEVPAPTTTEENVPAPTTTEAASLPTATEPSEASPALCDEEEEDSESSRGTTRRTTRSRSSTRTRTRTHSKSKSGTRSDTSENGIQNDNIGCSRPRDTSGTSRSHSHSTSTSKSGSHSSKSTSSERLSVLCDVGVEDSESSRGTTGRTTRSRTSTKSKTRSRSGTRSDMTGNAIQNNNIGCSRPRDASRSSTSDSTSKGKSGLSSSRSTGSNSRSTSRSSSGSSRNGNVAQDDNSISNSRKTYSRFTRRHSGSSRTTKRSHSTRNSRSTRS